MSRINESVNYFFIVPNVSDYFITSQGATRTLGTFDVGCVLYEYTIYFCNVPEFRTNDEMVREENLFPKRFF